MKRSLAATAAILALLTLTTSAAGASLDLSALGGDRARQVMVNAGHTEDTGRHVLDLSARYAKTAGKDELWHAGATSLTRWPAGLRTDLEAYWHQDHITSAAGLGIGAGGFALTAGVRTEAADHAPRDTFGRLAASYRGATGAWAWSLQAEALVTPDDRRLEWRNALKRQVGWAYLAARLDRSRRTDVWGLSLGFQR